MRLTLADRMARLLGPSGLRAVLYHHISDRVDPFTDRLGVRTPPALFEAHLEHYRRHYHVVDLETVLHGELPPRALLITFDDAYRSVYEHALPLLARHGLPAVFFVATAPVQRRELMLDNLLCYLSHQVGVAALAETVGGQRNGCQALGELIAGVLPSLPYPRRVTLGRELVERFKLNPAQLYEQADLYLSPQHLPELAGNSIEIGNHTQHHVHCRALSDERAIEAEVRAPQVQLRAWSGRAVRSFSYPYGRHADAAPRAHQAVVGSGHSAVFLVHARTNPPRHGGPTWYRVSLTEQPPAQLFRRIELWPRLRAFRARLTRPREVSA